jgi:hypothetical protein
MRDLIKEAAKNFLVAAFFFLIMSGCVFCILRDIGEGKHDYHQPESTTTMTAHQVQQDAIQYP